jgi:alpha-mannosidase
MVSAIKKAEDSDHVILRMYEWDGKDTEARVGSFFRIGAVEHTNIIEEHPQPTGPGLKLGKHAIETFRLSLED